MPKKIITLVFIYLLANICFLLHSQEGPSIKVESVFNPKNYRWKNHISISDAEGIHEAAYRSAVGEWKTLTIDPTCAEKMSWTIETFVGRIRDVRASDCCFGASGDSTIGSRSMYHYDSVGSKNGEPAIIVVEWLFVNYKEDLQIVSVKVTSGDLTDENGEKLDPSDFIATGGGFTGYVAKVKGTGTLEVILDPAGDLNYYVYDIYSTRSKPDFIPYIYGAIFGVLLLIIIQFLFRRSK